jgi:hypothetical protein
MNGWPIDDDDSLALLSDVWIPVGAPGFNGASKTQRHALLDERFGADGWRYAHVVRGRVVPVDVAILEYEEAYRQHLGAHPALVAFLATRCGNVYDTEPSNVYDVDYLQPHTSMNHYQDISVRRVVAELVDDPAWPDVVDTEPDEVPLLDLASGDTLTVPRARGFRGALLLQLRGPDSAGFVLNPAVVPVHDPALITTLPSRHEWYHLEGCAHLSVEAFWQMSKVVEVRYDRFLLAGPHRVEPLAGI